MILKLRDAETAYSFIDNYLQEHRGRVGARPDLVVVEPGVECAQVDLVVKQVIQRVLEGPGQQLRLEVYREEPGAGIDVLVVGHRSARSSQTTGLATRMPARQTRRMVFLQPR
jgi:hypothetical protein